jgi:WhiB family redox-sensing transcriptional regulator
VAARQSGTSAAGVKGEGRQTMSMATPDFQYPPEWTAQAICAQTDPEAFFPDRSGSLAIAKTICNGNPARGRPPCPVLTQCLEYALAAHEKYGIWGGMSPRERLAMQREELAA